MAPLSTFHRFFAVALLAITMSPLCQGTYKKSGSSKCFCDSLCTYYNDCCSSSSGCPASTGKQCLGNCYEKYNSGDSCHCDSQCQKYKDCCSDFSSVCLCPGGGNCDTALCDKMLQAHPHLCEVDATSSGELVLYSKIFHKACPDKCGLCH